MTPTNIPSAAQRRNIAAAACMPERGVLRVYRTPDRVRPASLERVRRAAQELGYSPPALVPAASNDNPA